MSVAAGVPSPSAGAWVVSLPRTRTPSSTVSPGALVRRLSPPEASKNNAKPMLILVFIFIFWRHCEPINQVFVCAHNCGNGNGIDGYTNYC